MSVDKFGRHRLLTNDNFQQQQQQPHAASNCITKQEIQQLNLVTTNDLLANQQNLLTKNEAQSLIANLATKNDVQTAITNLISKNEVRQMIANLVTKNNFQNSLVNLISKSEVQQLYNNNNKIIANLITRQEVDKLISSLLGYNHILITGELIFNQYVLFNQTDTYRVPLLTGTVAYITATPGLEVTINKQSAIPILDLLQKTLNANDELRFSVPLNVSKPRYMFVEFLIKYNIKK